MHTVWTLAADIPRRRGNYVYSLVDPRDGTVRYVGKTCGHLSRALGRHFRESTDSRLSHKRSWLRVLVAAGLQPELRVIEEVDAELGERERWWIAQFRSIGASLTNSTDGGEGMPNPSAETRAKLRAGQARRPARTPEERERRSATMRLLWQDPTFRARQAKSIEERFPNRRRVMPRDSDEFREWQVQNAKRMGALNKGKPKSPDHRSKLAAAQRARVAKSKVTTSA